MAIKAVVFDVGGVLELVDDMSWLRRWQAPEVSDEQFDASLRLMEEPDLVATGALTEAEYLRRYADALDLAPGRLDDFATAMWDWYCGRPDEAMIAYARSLRPAYVTAILSNSADGARREEQRRYGFEQLVDTVIYSHEVGLAKPDPRIYALLCRILALDPGDIVFVDDVPANVTSARDIGIRAVLHEDTARSIAAIEALLG